MNTHCNTSVKLPVDGEVRKGVANTDTPAREFSEDLPLSPPWEFP